MAESYYPYSNIKIQSASDEFIRKVKGCLNRILTMARGAEFLSAIHSSGHTLTIKEWGGRTGNSCGMDSDGYTLLSQSIKQSLPDKFKAELGKAITSAEGKGLKRDFIATQLSEGLLPTTYNASDNVGAPSSRVQVPQSEQQKGGESIMAFHGQKAMQARAFLDELIKGTRRLGDAPDSWKNDLQRILRDFLNPGRGCSCDVYFNPEHLNAASGNPALKNRPPTIGLAHEMVHAYRAMYGLTLQVYYNGKDLEEVITSGIPPYQYEKFSENIFRTQYKGEEQKIRMKY